jgi:glucose/arabinose dehydrogenase
MHRILTSIGFLMFLLLPDVASSAIVLQSIPALSNLSAPVFVTSALDGSNRLFVVEQGGIIKVLPPDASAPTVFLNVVNAVATGDEQGLLGLAFHPDFATNRRLYVSQTRKSDGALVVAEFQVQATNPNKVAKNTRRPIIVVLHPGAGNHNGGWIGFGPDGFLYIATGDGGGANDQHGADGNAQNINSPLGKILRVDVDRPTATKGYSSPADNPFVGVFGRDEIFAWGFRNPWRASFDRQTGALYVGDVGQGRREEVDIVTRGGNYGWRFFEGDLCSGLDPETCDDPGFTAPVAVYVTHSNTGAGTRCAVTGGYVYRGTAGTLPAGTYVFADYCSGEIFTLQNGVVSLLLDTGFLISSFGEDEAGELYVVNRFGSIHQIVNNP